MTRTSLANLRLTGKTLDVYKGYLRGASMRSGGEGQLAAFARSRPSTSCAYAAKMDPIAFRRLNIVDDVWLTALDAAARGANWKPRVAASNLSKDKVVTGRGVGVGTHGTAARSAAVVDITVDKSSGKITVTHVYNGIDAGLIVNPEGVENQMVGGAIFGLSRALQRDVHHVEVARHEPGLGHVPDPALQGRSEDHERHRAAGGQAAARRGRAAVLPDSGGDRECVLRRHGCAHPRGADDAGAGAGDTEGSRGRLGATSTVERGPFGALSARPCREVKHVPNPSPARGRRGRARGRGRCVRCAELARRSSSC